MPEKKETLSELEKLQRQNREANRKVLQELGLLEPLPPLPSAIRIKKRPAPAAQPRPAKKARPQPPADGEYGTELSEGRRRSTRQSNKPVKFSSLDYGSDIEDDSGDEDYDDERPRQRKPYTPRIRVAVPKNRENVYGAIPGVAVGTWWETRIECCAAGIHRPPVSGIHGGPTGAYSIALSGGYEDDLDWGECFTYTGEGGRDLKGTSAQPKNLRTAPQSKNQELTRGNLALSRNVETRTPVRVIRGYKLQSPYAPEEGYRYDGLYWVEKFWLCEGQSGFLVYKFAMKRCEDQPPPPWQAGESGDSAEEQTSEKEEEEEKESVETAKKEKKGRGKPKKVKEAAIEEKDEENEAEKDSKTNGEEESGQQTTEDKPTEGAENEKQSEKSNEESVKKEVKGKKGRGRQKKVKETVNAEKEDEKEAKAKGEEENGQQTTSDKASENVENEKQSEQSNEQNDKNNPLGENIENEESSDNNYVEEEKETKKAPAKAAPAKRGRKKKADPADSEVEAKKSKTDDVIMADEKAKEEKVVEKATEEKVVEKATEEKVVEEENENIKVETVDKMKNDDEKENSNEDQVKTENKENGEPVKENGIEVNGKHVDENKPEETNGKAPVKGKAKNAKAPAAKKGRGKKVAPDAGGDGLATEKTDDATAAAE